MRKVAEAGLKKTERSTAVEKKVGNVIKNVSTFKDLINQAIQAVLQAAILWVGVSLAFKVRFFIRKCCIVIKDIAAAFKPVY